MRALDSVLPTYDRHEVHAVVVDASPDVAVAAMLSVPAGSGTVARLLLRARGLRAAPSLHELLVQLGFAVLHHTSTEVVVGGAGRPWTLRGGIHAFAEARPGEVRVAVDLRATALADGRSRLSTETRIAAVDRRARRAFGAYWLVVGPFSAILRRQWLRAAAAAIRAGGRTDVPQGP